VGSPVAFDVVNPSTGSVFAQAPECTPALLDEAVAGARAAFKTWQSTSSEDRSSCLRGAMGRIQEKVPAIAGVLTSEQGKPLGAATGELQHTLFFLDHVSKLRVEDTVLVDNDKETVIEKHVPLGVVGGITPWNYPALMAAWKLGEAVMTGNTVVLKPSPHTPLSTLMLSEAFADAFPPGVVNLVSGGDDLGAMMASHPGIAKISFTGSTRTGKAIQAAASGTLKRLTLELGGNDPAIVLRGADVKSAARGIFAAAMQNTGQVCIAVKRAYVPESLHDEFVEELAAEAAKARVGDGFERGVQFGPINNRMQYDRVCELVEDAKRAGARVHSGGTPLDGPGFFYPLTVLSNVREGVRIVDEEQFGPVLPVISYADEDEAVARANDSSYGLGGSVWGPTERAAEVAARIDSGSVWVNSHGKLSPDVPFGGRRESGIGRQMGSGTIAGYTDTKVIRIPKENRR